MRNAVVGGTGDFGLALAQQLVAAGEDVVISSRDADRAAPKRAEVGAAGGANDDAVHGVDIVVLAVKSDVALPTTTTYLAKAIGALDVGPLASERALEGMTAVIVNLNQRYRGHAGGRVVGLP